MVGARFAMPMRSRSQISFLVIVSPASRSRPGIVSEKIAPPSTVSFRAENANAGPFGLQCQPGV